jgi:pyruvate-ferredoxin/flavodoxin oxidoreductase
MTAAPSEAPPDEPFVTVDGNEAAARIAHKVTEVIAIYPITPASGMGELADAWSAAGECNLWGGVPDVVEMQSEAGAAGALHGALQAGALATTFTASQGLLLMLPNMFKIAGELTPAVVHVAARTIATHALSIFGDHSDVMAARTTGFALLSGTDVQEAQDLALVAHAATLRSRVPFLHFFDGFRTSHEVAKIRTVDDATIAAMIDLDAVARHRERALHPSHPVLRGSAQNPDVYFQAREASNPWYDAVPGIVEAEMERFAALTGRRYRLFDYHGSPDAERVVVLMGSAAGPARDVVERLCAQGERVGVLVVHLYRPFSVAAFADALPDSVRAIAVLDRTKEPGALGEPLYTDVVTALVEARGGALPTVVGGRYGLSSKELTPAMLLAVFDELAGPRPRNHFTLGIVDDVTNRSLAWDEDRWHEPDDVVRAVFYGLGADGTVGANKNSVKIIGDFTDLHAQGYFVYDSKKSGSVTTSHLRFGPRPIRSTFLIREASFVACHQFGFLERIDVLREAAHGATFLLNSPFTADRVWDELPAEVQRTIIDKRLRFFVVDGAKVAREAGLGGRINTVLQTCFFALSGVLPRDEAIAAIKHAIAKSYGRRGEVVLQRNYAAVDASLAALHEVTVPASATSTRHMVGLALDGAPEFVQRVTARMLAGEGDLLPVSAFPIDGTFPTGTAKWEKRSIAAEIPVWDPTICIDCGRCALVCPHAAIRMKIYDPAVLDGAPDALQAKDWGDKDHRGQKMTIQVAPDDCTGCSVCVSVCPAKSKEQVKHKAIDMAPKADHAERERVAFDFFLTIPEADRTTLKLDTIKGSQLAQPLFEFSGACSGCGETPYLKLLTQLFGERIVVANATGCSSIYGGNLPTTPWSTNDAGRGPAWANSLFEDNAEFGLGLRLAADNHLAEAQRLLRALGDDEANGFGELAAALLVADQSDEAGIAAQRARVAELDRRLATIDAPEARRLAAISEHLVRTSVWIVGGDGWAYDIGFGGLDHVLASGRDVNVLVLDTEVYSNTGGQTSKATPRGAVAKFSASGKSTGKKDLGQIAMAYGNVYVAQVAMGANMTQVVRAFAEAEAHRGPSLIIAYSPCIAHGIDMADQMQHQKLAADSGYWPLYRFDPAADAASGHGFSLDSSKPKIPFRDLAVREARFGMLARSQPERANELLAQAQHDIDSRWQLYEQMVGVHRSASDRDEEVEP